MNEKDIIGRFKTGMEPAFAEIFNLYFPGIYLFVSKLVDDEARNDITQEAFIKLWEHKSSIADLEHAQRFLYLTARNKCIDYLRFRQSEEKKINEIRRMNSRDFDLYAQHSVIIHDQLELIDNAVKKLGPQYQEIYKYAYREGRSNQEIANLMGIAVATVINKKTILLKKVREIMSTQNLPQIASVLIIDACVLLHF